VDSLRARAPAAPGRCGAMLSTLTQRSHKAGRALQAVTPQRLSHPRDVNPPPWLPVPRCRPNSGAACRVPRGSWFIAPLQPARTATHIRDRPQGLEVHDGGCGGLLMGAGLVLVDWKEAASGREGALADQEVLACHLPYLLLHPRQHTEFVAPRPDFQGWSSWCQGALQRFVTHHEQQCL